MIEESLRTIFNDLVAKRELSVTERQIAMTLGVLLHGLSLIHQPGSESAQKRPESGIGGVTSFSSPVTLSTSPAPSASLYFGPELGSVRMVTGLGPGCCPFCGHDMDD